MNEIGDKLKEARKAKGYTLDDLQQMTKIQKRYLIAVEEGNLDVLPGDFYARAFIKQYADSVGLNGEDLIQEHMDTLSHTDQAEYTKGVQNTQTRSKTKNSGFAATLRDSLPTLLIVLLVIAIIFAIYLAITTGENANTDSFINENDSAAVIEVEDSEEESSDQEGVDTDEEADTDYTAESEEQIIEEISGSDTNTAYTVSGAHPSEQEIVLMSEGGRSWVDIRLDGVSVNEGTIEDGGSLITEFDDAVSDITLIIGNASSTTVLLNDQEVPYKSSGNEQEVQTVNLEFE